MFDFISGIWHRATDFVHGVGRLIGGTGTEDPLARLPLFDITFGDLAGAPILPWPFDPPLPDVAVFAEEVAAGQDFSIGNQVTPGLDVFEGETTTDVLSSPDDHGLATFEPDILAVDLGTIEGTSTAEDPEMPIHLRAIGAIAPIVSGVVTGAAFAVGNVLVDAFGGGEGGVMGVGDGGMGTSTEVPALATTPGLNGNGLNGAGVSNQCGPHGPTIAQIRGLILKSIGARHGRCSFSYNVARRILRDLGEDAGAGCLGITRDQACFLLIHPPKRRGRQITPKQINRAMGAYKRVRALNKSVRKTLGPGCKL